MKENILISIDGLIANFVYYDRKVDETLSAQQLNEAVSNGDVTIDEMVKRFRTGLENTFK